MDRPAKEGWLSEVDTVWSNKVFAVLKREVPTMIGTVTHLAIRDVAGEPLLWRHLQRIKNELIGLERVAVEVYPPVSELVDQANMYHLWVLPEGVQLPFTLSGNGHR